MKKKKQILVSLRIRLKVILTELQHLKKNKISSYANDNHPFSHITHRFVDLKTCLEFCATTSKIITCSHITRIELKTDLFSYLYKFQYGPFSITFLFPVLKNTRHMDVV